MRENATLLYLGSRFAERTAKIEKTRKENDERMVGMTVLRCAWVGTDPRYVRYHDEEWGVPVHDDRRIFEFLILEGAQAGLS